MSSELASEVAACGQIEDVAVPVKTDERALQTLEERIEERVGGERDLVPADLFAFAFDHRRSEHARKKLAPQANAEDRCIGRERLLDEAHLVSEVGIAVDLIDAHRSPHDRRPAASPRLARNRLAFEGPDETEIETARLELARHEAGRLGSDVLQDQNVRERHFLCLLRPIWPKGSRFLLRRSSACRPRLRRRSRARRASSRRPAALLSLFWAVAGSDRPLAGRGRGGARDRGRGPRGPVAAAAAAVPRGSRWPG